jgi:large subunit ribosomal protein L25
MSQSLRVIKRFRLHELINPLKHSTPTTTTTITTTAENSKLPPSIAVATLLNPFVPHKNPASGRWAPPRYSLRRQAELIKHARASNTLHLLPASPKMSAEQMTAAAAAVTTTTAAAAADRALEAENNSSSSSSRSGSIRKVGLMRDESVEEVQQEQEGSAWTRSVNWIGTVRERRVAGADIGVRLYAGKKRMFKGHKWERVRERRAIRTRILLRDMDKRVQRFKRVRRALQFVFFAQFCFFVFFLFSWDLVPCQG